MKKIFYGGGKFIMKQNLSRSVVGLCMILLLGLVFVTSVQASDFIPISERGYAHPESLVSCEELNGLLEEDNVVMLIIVLRLSIVLQLCIA